ncbi:MAG: UDP-N-acetylglucosamine 4,6-dehydratase (inverting) [Candidatus Bathyarchaeota archaeon]|nr:UDP-N-acetylglucosamine 4,6-dehydratase (inverting) [Candidatus Bathyarchaeota archaeon]
MSDKVVLITGGTGSFGQRFTEIVLREHEPKALRIFSRGELLQYEMRLKFNDDPRLRFFIGDVRDRERVYRAMNGVDIVVHAAALKQVPTAEYIPIEAVRTNIDGAINIIDAAIDNGAQRIIAISTDKAVHPVNLYGATKLVMERLMIQANVYSGWRKSRFSCVRYGNVVGSRGSVVPLFKEQMKSGVITITDEKMTRFWITLGQGIRFVIDSIERMQGGEVFVPKIPSMSITDLADVIAPKVKRQVVGIRPGEKLHEIILTEEEARHAKEFDDYFVIEPEHLFWGKDHTKGGKPLPAGFKYTSDNNVWWLSKDELKTIIEEH